MITNAKFKVALKEMMAEVPLEDINVTTLCAKCGCHRQTFYYHYQDIYDLIQAILLSEDVPKFDSSKTIREALRAFVAYAKDNYAFLQQAYNSAAKDLVDDFMFSKFNVKFYNLSYANQEYSKLKIDAKRDLSRRFANIIASEIGYCFKGSNHNPEWFQKKMNKFIDNALATLLPGCEELSRKEEGK